MASLFDTLQSAHLANAFTEAVYERFIATEKGEVRHLLAFTRELPEPLRQFFHREGIQPISPTDVSCYQSLWELPEKWSSKTLIDFISLDETVARGLGVYVGKYSSNAGYWVSRLKQPTGQPISSPLLQHGIPQAAESETRMQR